MFDIDSGKLLIVAVLALIVIGPKELPRVLRQIGQSVGKMRRMATEFQGQFMDAMKEADIADIRKELDELNKTAALDVHFDPARDLQAELTNVMAPLGSVTAETTVASPASGFVLPTGLDAVTEGTGETGIATPVEETTAVEPPMSESVPHLNGTAVSDGSPAKRKIFVKRRVSSFNIVQAEQKALSTGEPFALRRRPVRAKTRETDGVPNS